MVIFQVFSSHPASVGESYGEHLAFASGVGARMVLGGLACMLHGLFPFLFTRTGSRTIFSLHRRIVNGGRTPANVVLSREIGVETHA